MSSYAKISREQILSSLKGSISFQECGILIYLMLTSSYKPTEYNLYGHQISLQKYELCASVRQLAEVFHLTRGQLSRLLKKFEEQKFLKLRKRDIASENSIANADRCAISCAKKRAKPRRYGYNGVFTSITLSESLFADCPAEEKWREQTTGCVPSGVPSPGASNNKVINNNLNKKNTPTGSVFSGMEEKEAELVWAEYIPLKRFRERDIDGFDEWWAFLIAETDTASGVLENRYNEFCTDRHSRGFTNMTKSKFTNDFIQFVTKQKAKLNKKTNGESTKFTGKTREQVVEEIERAREAAANGDFSVTPEC